MTLRYNTLSPYCDFDSHDTNSTSTHELSSAQGINALSTNPKTNRSQPARPFGFKRIKAIVGLVIFSLGSGALGTGGFISGAYALEPTKIIYQLELDSERFGKATLGRIETQLSETDGHYFVASHTKAEGMAAILVGNLTESCEFNIVDGRAQSQHYSGGRPDKVEYFVGFNWVDRKIVFNNQETLDMPQGYLVDNCNLPFALALLKDQEIKETIYIVDGKKTRIRGYQFQSKSREMLSTKIGSLDTIKVVFARELKPEKTLTLWLSKKHHFLPVKIQERREERTTTMFVSEYSTLD